MVDKSPWWFFKDIQFPVWINHEPITVVAMVIDTAQHQPKLVDGRRVGGCVRTEASHLTFDLLLAIFIFLFIINLIFAYKTHWNLYFFSHLVTIIKIQQWRSWWEAVAVFCRSSVMFTELWENQSFPLISSSRPGAAARELWKGQTSPREASRMIMRHVPAPLLCSFPVWYSTLFTLQNSPRAAFEKWIFIIKWNLNRTFFFF